MSEQKITTAEKKKLKLKLLEFRKKGLLQYGKYLDDQLKASTGKKLKEYYKKYIEDQIEANTKKINKISKKMTDHL